MKSLLPSLLVAFLIAVAANVAVAQTPAAAIEQSPPNPVPPEMSVEARAQYEAQLKTLHTRIADRKWQEALASAEALHAQRPREPQARFLKTVILTELGRDDEAQTQLIDLLSDYPELPEPHNNLAALYAKKGEYDLAQRELELALASAPGYGIAHANLADLYLERALQQYQRAAALMPSGKEGKELRARADAVKALLASSSMSSPSPAVNGGEETENGAAAADSPQVASVKEGESFFSAGCEAPPGFGEENSEAQEEAFPSGTCEINFDEEPAVVPVAAVAAAAADTASPGGQAAQPAGDVDKAGALSAGCEAPPGFGGNFGGKNGGKDGAASEEAGGCDVGFDEPAQPAGKSEAAQSDAGKTAPAP